MQLLKAAILASVVFAAIGLLAFFSYNPANYSGSVNCLANPGWESCVNARNAALGETVLTSFGIAATIAILNVKDLLAWENEKVADL